MGLSRTHTYEHAGQAAGMHSHTHVAAQVRMSERVSETYQKMNFFFFLAYIIILTGSSGNVARLGFFGANGDIYRFESSYIFFE